jgi:uncharacterized iron-regulated membrane protein
VGKGLIFILVLLGSFALIQGFEEWMHRRHPIDPEQNPHGALEARIERETGQGCMVAMILAIVFVLLFTGAVWLGERILEP